MTIYSYCHNCQKLWKEPESDPNLGFNHVWKKKPKHSLTTWISESENGRTNALAAGVPYHIVFKK